MTRWRKGIVSKSLVESDYVKLGWGKSASGEVSEWFKVPLSKFAGVAVCWWGHVGSRTLVLGKKSVPFVG